MLFRSEFDQDEWLEHLEEHLKEIVNISGKDVHTLAADIEMHRREKWTQDFRRLGIDFLDLQTTDNFMPPLRALFARRSRKFSR